MDIQLISRRATPVLVEFHPISLRETSGKPHGTEVLYNANNQYFGS